ncbi:MAG: hypothetical protein DDG60_16025 [Anaerolineae bacterium]|nr:MAG: hypothetical protein DDG60_16025 [Anaerolineae bacterium]
MAYFPSWVTTTLSKYAIFTWYAEKFGKDWAGLDWKFHIGGNYGPVWFDELRQVQLSGYRK